MNTKVLVAYSTKYGATAEIAQCIADVLRAANLDVTVSLAEQVADVARYDAVVLGSAVYGGNWQKGAAELLENQQVTLAARPVWLFSSGPTTEGDPVETMHGWRFPHSLQPVADDIKPQDIMFFHGKLDLAKMHVADRLIMLAMRVPPGDFRNWDAIREWAKQIAQALEHAVAT